MGRNIEIIDEGVGENILLGGKGQTFIFVVKGLGISLKVRAAIAIQMNYYMKNTKAESATLRKFRPLYSLRCPPSPTLLCLTAISLEGISC